MIPPKLTPDQVQEIRRLYLEGGGTIRTLRTLANRYGVSLSTLRRINARPRPDAAGNHGNAKINQEQAKDIRTRYAAGDVLQKELAAEYGLSKAAVTSIIRNLTWVDDDYTPPASGSLRSPASKLTRDQVIDIRTRYARDTSMQELADTHGVSKAAIALIIANKTWTDPDYTPPDYSRRGWRSPTAPGLTPQKVKEIRERYAAGGETTRSLGAAYGVSAVTISKIIRNVFWVDPSYTPPSR